MVAVSAAVTMFAAPTPMDEVHAMILRAVVLFLRS